MHAHVTGAIDLRLPLTRPSARDRKAAATLEAILPHVLSLGLRFRPIRWLLARMRWPRPEHLSLLSRSEFQAYVNAIGLEAEAQAALPEYRGEKHHTAEAHPALHGAQGRPDRRPGPARP